MRVVRWGSDVTGRKPKLWAERHKNYKTKWDDLRLNQFYQQQVIWYIVVAALSSVYFFKFSVLCSFHPQTHKHKRLHLKQAECTTYVLPPHPGMRVFWYFAWHLKTFSMYVCSCSVCFSSVVQTVSQHRCSLNPPALLLYWHHVSALTRPLALCLHLLLSAFCISLPDVWLWLCL